MQLAKTFPWHDPMELAHAVTKEQDVCCFLYSGQDVGYSGRFSILAYEPEEIVYEDDFSALEERLSSDKDLFDNAWFGYLGYGLKNCLEKLPKDQPDRFNLKNLLMIQYNVIIIFDHVAKEITVFSNDANYELPRTSNFKTPPFSIQNLSSNMTKQAYLDKVEIIRNNIGRGDLSQANLTRKFFGSFKDSIDNFNLFTALVKISPASYSSYLKYNEVAIISSSPEQFLKIDGVGNVQTRPIKGTAKRFSNPKDDKESYNTLKNSQKDKAENLMIVDLMRNDLSRSCEIGSVHVKDLFKVTSYPTIHHMSSTIFGKKRENYSAMEVVKAAFPPGSMTGTPKIKAMEICSELEQQRRGVYSGAIGWFGGDGSADLSVVIRTLISNGKEFEFQVGGAITVDSTAEGEWQETIDKSAAIIKALNITEEQILKI